MFPRVLCIANNQIRAIPRRILLGNLRLSASSGFLCVPCVEVLTLAVDYAFGFLRVFAPPRWMFLFGCGSAALCLMLFEDGSEETITGVNAGNRAQEVAADQLIDVFPGQFTGLLQAQ